MYNSYSDRRVKKLIFGILTFFLIAILFIKIYVNILIGTILGNLMGIIIFFVFVYIILSSLSKTERSENNNSINNNYWPLMFLVIVFGMLILYYGFNLGVAIMDCFEGAKVVNIESYSVKKIQKEPKSITQPYYNLIGYDKNGNKYELKSKNVIEYYDDKKIKIKYYKNIGWIDSFEYLEKTVEKN